METNADHHEEEMVADDEPINLLLTRDEGTGAIVEGALDHVQVLLGGCTTATSDLQRPATEVEGEEEINNGGANKSDYISFGGHSSQPSNSAGHAEIQNPTTTDIESKRPILLAE